MAKLFAQYFIIVVLVGALYTIWTSSLRAAFAIPLAASGLVTFVAWFFLKKRRGTDEMSSLILVAVGLLVFFLLPRSWYANIRFSTLDSYSSTTVAVDPSLMSLLLFGVAVYLAWESGLLQSMKRFLG